MVNIRISNTDDFYRLVKIGKTTESIQLDFKQQHNSSKKNWPEECALDIAQFANTIGGTLLYGIEEAKSSQTSLKTASRILGVSNPEDIKQAFNTKVRNHLHPSNLNFETFAFEVDNKTIVAVNVPPLESGCASVSRSDDPRTYRYPYRTEFGKAFMLPHQVEEIMSDKSRSIRLKMQRLCFNNEIRIISSVDLLFYRTIRTGNLSKTPRIASVPSSCAYPQDKVSIRVSEMTSSEFILSISGKTIHIPYGFVSEVWDMGFNRTGMALNCKLVVPKHDAPIRILIN
jgi:hypothetical protein